MEIFTIALSFYYLFSILIISHAADTITKNQLITDGKTIVSSGETFEMGFFSPGKSRNRYVGIWYKKLSTGPVVWVANRVIPLADSSGVLKVIDPGILALLNGNNDTIWSANTSISAKNPVVQLLDSGNLVLREAGDEHPDNFLWQSFDYPCDTHLPGMKIGKNLVTGREWFLTSWKTKDDPARGDYKFWFDLRGYPQIFASSGSRDLFRFGSWNGLRFTGTPAATPVISTTMYFGKDEVYYKYDNLNGSFSRATLNPSGVIERWIWHEKTHRWAIYRSGPNDNCDNYKVCGAYGSCSSFDSPVCSCLRKFVPKYPRDWELTDWTNGCVRSTPLNCHGDGFVKYSSIKLPDTRSSWYSVGMTLQECAEICLKNCSCMAYTTLNISASGSGCLLWFGDLVDIRVFSRNGQDLYVRMASSDLDLADTDSSSSKKRTIILVTIGLFAGMVLLVVCILLCVQKKKKNKKNSGLKLEGRPLYSPKRRSASREEDIDLPLFDFTTIVNATNDFLNNNKLGEGGFGPVYKGTLAGGQEIAVKRLSKNSRQGIYEFKNEIVYIAKLQHRNLVKLLGCCFQDDEMMLVYEYLPNKSLDRFIFDQNRSKLLDWRKRINIINGIARGLLYLHQDSRLRIVHRDLKAENVLLDNEMNAKISDFGLARSFGGNETEANTNKVVGTHGYISPEYAVNGLYSVKSDVFSFGVLVLEIISGRRNRGFNHPEHGNLLGHAWQMYLEGRTWELIDAPIKDSWNASELLRIVNIGLLCVQQRPEDRPNMSAVVLMLGGEGSTPRPKQPGFFEGKNRKDTESSSSHIADSGNELTITQLQPR